MALVLVIATDRRMAARHWAKVGSGRADRLDAGFLVIGDDRHRGLLRGSTRDRPLHLDLTIDAKHFGHFSVRTRDRAAPGSNAPPPSRGQALVRLDLMRCQDLAH